MVKAKHAGTDYTSMSICCGDQLVHIFLHLRLYMFFFFLIHSELFVVIVSGGYVYSLGVPYVSKIKMRFATARNYICSYYIYGTS